MAGGSMNAAIIAALLSLADKLIPNQIAREQFKLALQNSENNVYIQELQALVQQDQAQAAVNQVEAGSESFFKSGWRPAVAWLCIAALAYQTVLEPVIAFVLANTGHDVVLPEIDTSVIAQLLFGLLGVMGGLRTIEKVKMGGF
jgi:hypothetical protein